MARLGSLAALLPLLALPGCSTVSVDSELDPSVDLAAYVTFVQASPPRYASVGLPGYTLTMGEQIGSTISSQLAEKGYIESDPAEADLLVAFEIEGDHERDRKSVPVYVGQLAAWERTPATEIYTAGRIVIEIYDSASRRILWKGIGEIEIFESDLADEVANEVVNAILARFPGRESS